MAGLPNITGGVISSTSYIFWQNGASGAFKIAGINGAGPLQSKNNDGNNTIVFDASRCSSIYKDSATTVVPESLMTNFYIRY